MAGVWMPHAPHAAIPALMVTVQIFEMTQKKRERCLQEVTLLQQLSHPYIIQMYDAFIDENMLIIIFEWAPAGRRAGGGHDGAV